MKNYQWLSGVFLACCCWQVPSVQASERFGGVEIGAKGIKTSAVELDTGSQPPSLKVLELDKKTIDVTISRLKGKKFETVLIDDAAEVAAEFVKRLVDDLGIPKANIQVVASSGVPFADNFPQLAHAVREKSGLQLDKIDSREEGALTTLALVPGALRKRTLVVDVGSGNIKGGMFLDESGAVDRFAVLTVPFGTTTFSKKLAEAKDAGDAPGLPGRVAAELIGEPLREQTRETPALRDAPQVLFAGGSVWAMVTILKPDTALEAFPKLTAADIKAYADLIKSSNGKYPDVDFDRIGDEAARKVARGDYDKIRGTAGGAPIFKPAELQAGAELLSQVGDALDFEGRDVYFDRKAVTAWITAKITPPKYRSLLPQALGRRLPTPAGGTEAASRPEPPVSDPPAGSAFVPRNPVTPRVGGAPATQSPNWANVPGPTAPHAPRGASAFGCDDALPVCDDPCGCASAVGAQGPAPICLDDSGNLPAPNSAHRTQPPTSSAAQAPQSALTPMRIAQRAAGLNSNVAAKPDDSKPRVRQADFGRASAARSGEGSAIANQHYGDGLHFFWRGDYAGAVEAFGRAAAAHEQDARFWYFKGLSEYRLGREAEALESLAFGTRLELQGRPARTVLNQSLERLQGSERLMLRAAASNARVLTSATARSE